MATYRLKQGYNVRIVGAPETTVSNAPAPSEVAINAQGFCGMKAKLAVKAGDQVKAGTPLFTEKSNDKIKFTSPVSGTVKEIARGARRALLDIVVIADGENTYEEFEAIGADALLTTPREKILDEVLSAGLFPFFVERPFAVLADPEKTPRDIFVSAFNTAPLSPEINVILEGNEAAFQAGLNALTRLTEGKVNLGIDASRSDLSSALTSAANVEVHKFTGAHPAGNVGVQAHHIKAVNKGETVWTITPQGVISIGKLFLEGKYNAERIVAVAGESATEKKHFKTISGVKLSTLLGDKPTKDHTVRVISGDILSGTKMNDESYLGFQDSLVTLIPEIQEREFMGWLVPGLNKESYSNTFLSWLTPSKKYNHNTGYHGGVRAMVQTGKYESVVPMDIYPTHLLKSIMYQDFEEMEALGIYEVAPEDLALCDYVCVSKIEAQALLREGLDAFLKEG